MEQSNQAKSPTKNLIVVGVIIGLIVLVGIFYFISNSKDIVEVSTIKSNNEALRQISISEISNHNSKEDCWTTINDGVYDITGFISQHKGGDKILNACGVDATEFFTGKHPTIGRVHSQMAVKLLQGMKIGDLQK